jgi:hypothetical protein
LQKHTHDRQQMLPNLCPPYDSDFLFRKQYPFPIIVHLPINISICTIVQTGGLRAGLDKEAWILLKSCNLDLFLIEVYAEFIVYYVQVVLAK